jgi:DNA-binding NarL/FixJ family response regulator
MLLPMKDILLLGGFRFVRSSLRNLLDTRLRANVIPTESLKSEEAKTELIQLPNKKPALIILDVSIPQSEGLEAFLDTKQAYPDSPILIINGSDEFDFAANYLRLGCSGYISKNYGIEEIIEGIKAVNEGKTYIKPDALQKKAMQVKANRKVHDALSKRELQVFFKLANGKSILSVANDLNISTSTVSVFRSKILKKMQFKNNADLILYAKDQHCLHEFN